MPNYSLVTDSTYQPLSFNEIWTPMQSIIETHNKMEEQYATLGDEASEWEKLANNPADKKQYEQYKKYASDIQSQSDLLMNRGMSGTTRKSLMSLRRRYNSEIKPIKDAYEARQKDFDMMREMDIKSNGRTIYTKNARQGLDSYMGGNRPDWSSTNLDSLSSEASALGKAISSRMYSKEEGNIAGEYFIDLIQKVGMDGNKVTQMLENPDLYPEFSSAIRDLKNKIGWDNYSEADQSKINSAIMEGLSSGIIYQEDHKPINNPAVLTAAERDASARGWAGIQLQREGQNLSAAASGFIKDSNGKWVRDPSNPINMIPGNGATIGGKTVDHYVPSSNKGKYLAVDADGNTISEVSQSNMIGLADHNTPYAPKTPSAGKAIAVTVMSDGKINTTENIPVNKTGGSYYDNPNAEEIGSVVVPILVQREFDQQNPNWQTDGSKVKKLVVGKTTSYFLMPSSGGASSSSSAQSYQNINTNAKPQG